MIDMDLRTIARALGGTVCNGEVLAPGPEHSRVDRSLSVRLDRTAPDGFIVHSFAKDDPIVCRDYVREKCGLPAFGSNRNDKPTEVKHAAPTRQVVDDSTIAAALAAIKTAPPKQNGKIVATYDYTDNKGDLLYQVLRYEPKTFRQRRPDGKGGWIKNVEGCGRVLYRLPELLKYPDAGVFVCEGEKDADRVASLDHCATTVACGDWTEDCVKALAGRDVLILRDMDEAGADKALKAATALHGTAKTIRIVELPGLTGHKNNKDVSDWLDADPKRAEKLVDICFDTPLWTPETNTIATSAPAQADFAKSGSLEMFPSPLNPP